MLRFQCKVFTCKELDTPKVPFYIYGSGQHSIAHSCSFLHHHRKLCFRSGHQWGCYPSHKFCFEMCAILSHMSVFMYLQFFFSPYSGLWGWERKQMVQMILKCGGNTSSSLPCFVVPGFEFWICMPRVSIYLIKWNTNT